MRNHRYLSLLISMAVLIGWQLSGQTQPLTVERQGANLRVSAPLLHLLEGNPLDQLHNGASVTYVCGMTINASPSGRLMSRFEQTFVVSFDLWEERFSVVQTSVAGRSASHLTASAAENWILESMHVPAPAVSQEKPFVIKLACRVVDKEAEPGAEARPGLTLAGLIDVFSRKEKPPELRWQAESGPLRLADLKAKH